MTAEQNRRRINHERGQDTRRHYSRGGRNTKGIKLRIERHRRDAPPTGRRARPRHDEGLYIGGGRIA